MKLADFSHLFRSEQDRDDEEAYARSTRILDWMRQDYHAEFEKWLDEQASKRFELGPKLVESAMRANTLREVQDHLRRIKKEALAARQRISEEA